MPIEKWDYFELTLHAETAGNPFGDDPLETFGSRTVVEGWDVYLHR